GVFYSTRDREIYPLPLHDALPIWGETADERKPYRLEEAERMLEIIQGFDPPGIGARDLRECILLQLRDSVAQEISASARLPPAGDRKSTRLNSSHVKTSYAVFCLK